MTTINRTVANALEAFPEGGKKIRVSGNIRGIQPRWRDDGKELYFLGTKANYDVTKDGQRFVVTEARDDEVRRVVTVLVNYLKK